MWSAQKVKHTKRATKDVFVSVKTSNLLLNASKKCVYQDVPAHLDTLWVVKNVFLFLTATVLLMEDVSNLARNSRRTANNGNNLFISLIQIFLKQSFFLHYTQSIVFLVNVRMGWSLAKPSRTAEPVLVTKYGLTRAAKVCAWRLVRTFTSLACTPQLREDVIVLTTLCGIVR